MSEWMAPKANFYAVICAAYSKEYNTVSKALDYFGIKLPQERQPREKGNYNKAPKFIIEKSILEELYLNKKMTQTEIAKMYGVTQTTISEKLKAFSIKTRDKHEATRLSHEKRGNK